MFRRRGGGGGETILTAPFLRGGHPTPVIGALGSPEDGRGRGESGKDRPDLGGAFLEPGPRAGGGGLDAEDHSDTWLCSERHRATACGLRETGGDPLGRGVATRRPRGVEGHGAPASWRLPRWVRPGARYGLAFRACAAADRPGGCGAHACGGSRDRPQ